MCLILLLIINTKFQSAETILTILLSSENGTFNLSRDIMFKSYTIWTSAKMWTIV